MKKWGICATGGKRQAETATGEREGWKGGTGNFSWVMGGLVGLQQEDAIRIFEEKERKCHWKEGNI